MKSIITAITVLISLSVKSQCLSGDYVNPETIPASLVLLNGDTLAISEDVDYQNVSITVMSGGVINICNGAEFNISGSLTVLDGALINIFDCNTRINVVGSYFDAYQTCQIESYCEDCETINFLSVSGSKFGGEICCLNPLPVELISYKCDINGVYWATASEVNSSHFILQTSNDGINWNEMDYVLAMGNTTDITEYSYEGRKEAYNRVIQYDMDGSYEVFDVLICESLKTSENKVAYYIDARGRKIKKESKGFKIAVYKDGTIKKILK